MLTYFNKLATTSENVSLEQQPCCDLNAMKGERWSAKMLSLSPLFDYSFWKNQWGDNIWKSYGSNNTAGIAIMSEV